VDPDDRLTEPRLEARQFLTAVVGSSSEAIVGKTQDGTVVSWNAAAERLYGYSAEEMIGRNITLICPSERRQELATLLAKVSRKETVRDLLTERVGKDGMRIPVSLTVSPVVGPDGTVLGASSIARDVRSSVEFVGELRRAQRSTAEALSMLETLQENAPVGFGFVDRDFRVVRVNKILAAVNGSSIEDHIGRRVQDVGPGLWPQLEAGYHHVLETGKPVVGVEVSGEIAGEPGGLHNWLLSVYPVFIGNEIIGLGIVTVDITERTRAERAQSALTHAVVDAIAATTEARDPYTAGHQSRVAGLASRIAADMGVDGHSIEGIDLAARIHDIGKMAIPSEILTKFTPLSNPEWELIKTHSKIGADIVRGIVFPWPIADMIEQHHERLDGSGYPDGLHGAEILIEARIIAVADVVEAMASHRPYRPARGVAVALEEIEQKQGTLFDPQAVDACLRLFREGHYSLEHGSD
jgi:PAS domain S-box-containing protein/putative nucleotidyltransferase with HDIG domain